ncbi:Zinc finger, SWIM-type [Trema orientale]|uniref:Zinc finger, SWIM-type n=1 Tax=Trema orientale TaxID=63057 RepID=A0A2P5EDD2_TREOI|nr:Zinc finger, SWIM-type [Trema orientale]
MSFEVELNDTNVGVKLDEQICDCDNWKLMGLPCIHALALLQHHLEYKG